MREVRFAAPLTPVIRRLIIVQAAIWFVGLLGLSWFQWEFLARFLHSTMLHPSASASDGFLAGSFWQPFTYMWLHDFNSLFHIGFNMLLLWLFGGLFESRWGGAAFLKFYVLCGIGGAVGTVLAALVAPDLFGNPVLGASGAILGLIAAFGLIFPRQPIYLWFILPIEGRHIIWLTIVLDTLMFLTDPRGFAFATHMGGLLTGYLLVTGNWRPALWRDRLRLLGLRRRRGRHLRVVEGDEKPPRWIN